MDEDTTLDMVLGGRSIARFGDGEINLIFGRKCITQPASVKISCRLKAILEDPGDCLIGIPHLNGPKPFWRRYDTKETRDLFNGNSYGSAFITRPDSAPWIDRPDYWDKIRSLWRGRSVTLVRGSDKSLTRDTLTDAGRVQEIIANCRDAFANYAKIRAAIRARPSDILLLCLGPTATILAHDFCQRGQWAVDLGHCGLFYKKHLNNEPMLVTEEDKAHDRNLRA